jgi:hypothetical protein
VSLQFLTSERPRTAAIAINVLQNDSIQGKQGHYDYYMKNSFHLSEDPMLIMNEIVVLGLPSYLFSETEDGGVSGKKDR